VFKAKIFDIKSFRTIFEAIFNLVDEVAIGVDEEGMKLRTMDPGHVVLVDLRFTQDFFDDFEVQGNNKIGIDLGRFVKYLKRFKDEATIELPENENMLEISEDMKTFRMPLIEVSEEELKVPSLDFPAMIEIEPNILEEAIKDAEIVSDNITFSIDGENFCISANDEVYGSAEITVPSYEALQFKIKEATTYRSMFNIEYLKSMVKAGKAASTVRVHLGNNIPVKLEFIATGVKLSFLLAPRIESD